MNIYELRIFENLVTKSPKKQNKRCINISYLFINRLSLKTENKTESIEYFLLRQAFL